MADSTPDTGEQQCCESVQINGNGRFVLCPSPVAFRGTTIGEDGEPVHIWTCTWHCDAIADCYDWQRLVSSDRSPESPAVQRC